MKNLKKLSGFSLVEMMVVLLIVAIVMAASAPMINKKMIKAAETSPWVWIGNNGNIGYNIGKRNVSAIIGDTTTGSYTSANAPRLFIRGDHAHGNNAQIMLASNNNAANVELWDKRILITNEHPTGDQSVTIGYDSNSTSLGAVSIGKGANASGVASIAIGRSANTKSGTSTHAGMIAIGDGAKAQANYTISIGKSANGAAGGSVPDHGVAIGESANTFGYGVALGAGAKTKGMRSVALGYQAGTNSQSGSENSIAIGRDTRTSKSAIAIGDAANTYGNNTATANQAIAIGRSSNASAENAVALGYHAYATGNNSICIAGGSKTFTSGVGGGNVTMHAQSTGSNSIAIGYEANSAGTNSIAIGGGYSYSNGSTNITRATQSDAIAIGHSANALGTNSIAIGKGADANYNDTTALGYSAVAGENCVAIGANAKTTRSSVAVGKGAKANSTGWGDSVAIGYSANATGEYATAIGDAATATGTYSASLGHMANAAHAYSVAIGALAETTAPNQIVLGDSSSTVYIPGRLVVDKGTILGRIEGLTHIRVYRQSHGTDQKIVDIRTMYSHSISGGDNIEIGDVYNSGTQANVIFSSDRRLKNVGKAFKGGLEEIKKLEVFHYTFKKDEKKTPRVGVMAQDLQKIFPDAVIKGEDGFLQIRMEDMFYALVNAIKELDNKINYNTRRIADLEKQNADLVKMVSEQKEQIAEQKEQIDKLIKRFETLDKKK